jgi:hypothetical protein
MALDAGTALKRPVLSAPSDEDFCFTLPAITASPKLKHRLRTGAKACCVPIVVLLAIARLGPPNGPHAPSLGGQAKQTNSVIPK